MKNTKLFTHFLLPVVISGVLASCSSSTKVASSFGKRKYTRGFFFDRPSKPVTPANATASVVLPKSNKTTTAIVTAQNNVVNPTSSVTTNNTISIAPISIVNHLKKSASVQKANTENSSSVAIKGSAIDPSVSHISAPEMGSTGNVGGYGGGNCKNWVLCFVLCALLGDIGIHRFYMGYIWQGVVQLLTLGGCGIWTFIDFIRILMKSLKPKDGDYC